MSVSVEMHEAREVRNEIAGLTEAINDLDSPHLSVLGYPTSSGIHVALANSPHIRSVLRQHLVLKLATLRKLLGELEETERSTTALTSAPEHI